MIRINERLTIPDDDLVFAYIRASGPGGQNVNKVSSAAQLRFDVTRASYLPPAVKQRLLRQMGRLSSPRIAIGPRQPIAMMRWTGLRR